MTNTPKSLLRKDNGLCNLYISYDKRWYPYDARGHRSSAMALAMEYSGLRTSREQHDDVIKWKHFLRYRHSVWGIHRSPVNSPHKKPVTRSFDAIFDLRLNKWLSKQSRRRCFETPSHSSCRHYNGNLFLSRNKKQCIPWVKLLKNFSFVGHRNL